MSESSRSVWTSRSRVRDLMDRIEARDIDLPHFHRGFVWSNEMSIALVESMRRGIPIGTVVLLEMRQLRISESHGSGLFPPAITTKRRFVLDGFQRLATLYGAFWGPRENGFNHPEPWSLLYDAAADEIRRAPRHGDVPASCIELWRLFDSRAFFEVGSRLIERGQDADFRRMEMLRATLNDCEVTVLTLQTDSLDEAIDTALRMNRYGVPWTELDVLLGSTHSSERDLPAELDDLRENLVPLGWGDIDPDLLLGIVKAAAGVDLDRTDPEEVAPLLVRRGRSVDDLLAALKRALSFLSETCGVAGPRMLPYRWQLVFLVEASLANEDLSGEPSARLRDWFWQTTYAEYFSGASPRRLRSARLNVLDLASGNAAPEPVDLDRRVEPLERLSARSVRTTAFLLLLASFRPTSLDRELPAARMLADGGIDAAPRIFHGRDLPEGFDARSPENRWLVPPDLADAVRSAIVRGQGTTAIPIERLLAGHAFSSEAARCLANGDARGTLVARRAELRRREQAFVTSLGLQYEG